MKVFGMVVSKRKISNWRYKFNLWRKYKKEYWKIFGCDDYLLNRRRREYDSGKIEIKDDIAFWALSTGPYPVADGVAITLDKLGLPVDISKTNDYRIKIHRDENTYKTKN